MKFKIERCNKEDAEMIARIVVMAIHRDWDENRDMREIFTALSARPDSQYSYMNALKAVTPEGEIAGIIVAYDGGKLHELHRAFREEYERVTGKPVFKLTEETVPGEWYLDSIAVFPKFRGQGVAHALIKAAIENISDGLVPGLLCAKDNPMAQKLYESMGFKFVGERPFFGEMMNHLTLS